MLKRLIVAVVILIGCAVAGIAVFKAWPRKGTQTETAKSPAVERSAPIITFRKIAIFDGRTADGFRFASMHYKSSDCVAVSELITFFNSAARAAKEVQRETSGTRDVVERSSVMDKPGQKIGERVVLRREGQPQAGSIIWNEGPNYHSLASSSLQHAIEFEKKSQTPNSGRIFGGMESARTATYDPIQTSEGPTDRGSFYRETRYQSSDCETVVERIEYFDSPEAAEEVMQTKLKESTGVMEEAQKLDSTGQVVGRRTVANFKVELPSEPIEKTIVMWTNGHEYHTIEGVYAYVLEFEKKNHSND